MKAVQIARQTGRLAVRSLSAAVAPQQAILRRRLGSSFAHPASNPSRSLILRRGYATSSAEPSSVNNPATVRAGELLELANRALEDGDVHGAKALYKQSCDVEATPTGWYNLGVCEYHLKDIEGAIAAWEKSLALSPSPDAHTNIASAYIMSKPPRPADAIKHLTSALELAPEDPEIAFNLAAVLESTDNLDHALSLYKRAAEGGVERAQQNIRNVSAKILGKQAKSAEAEQK